MRKRDLMVYSMVCAMTGSAYALELNEDKTTYEKEIAAAPTAVDDYENRTMYGVMMHNPLHQYQWGVTKFNSADPVDMELLFPWEGTTSIYAGAAAHGEYYGYFYSFDGTAGPRPVSLAKINLRTGEIRDVKDWSNLTFKLQDMTFDYSTNTMYAVGYEYGSNLYKIDINTGDIEMVVKLPKTIATIAANYKGELYGADLDGSLMRINKETGELKFINTTFQDLLANQTMEFDHTDGALYWASCNSSGNNPLYKFDIEKNTFKSVGYLGGNGTQIVGLYIPYVIDGFDTPSNSTDVVFSAAAEGKEEATISWTNPVMTHGGKELTEISAITILRDGVTIGSFGGVKPGEQLFWKDKSVKTGEHIYTIVASNDNGDGVKTEIDGYVGIDTPEKIKNLFMVSGDNCKSINISWDPCTVGAHEGYFPTDDITYTVTRYPDKVVVADKIKETSFFDNTMRRLAQYSYSVVANNVSGSSRIVYSTQGLIAGNPLEIPYSCEFYDMNTDLNQWSSIDGNNDGLSWYYNSGFSNMVFSDISFGAEYVQQGDTSEEDADEWLISPPLNFTEGNDYYITFEARSYGYDVFNVSFGTGNSPQYQTTFKSGLTTNNTREFEKYTVSIPSDMIKTGIHCFGFNLITKYPQSGIFQITNVAIEEGIPAAIDNVTTAADNSVVYADGKIRINGTFDSAKVYNLSGVLTATVSGTDYVSAEGWSEGVYIVKVKCDGSEHSYRVIVR